MIKIIRSERITPTETQWELDVNGKNVYVAKWIDYDFIEDYEIFKGKELLTEDEEEEVIEFIDLQVI